MPTSDPYQFFSAVKIAELASSPVESVRANWPKLVEQLEHCGINDRATQVAMIGTVAIETANRFRPIHEFRNADGSIPHYWHNYEGGAEFHGRGYIQITHRSNYAKYGPKIAELWGTPMVPELDLVADPERALDADISAAIAALYFRDHGGDGQARIAQAARAGNWREVRRLVQGGDAKLDVLEAIARAADSVMGCHRSIDRPTPDWGHIGRIVAVAPVRPNDSQGGMTVQVGITFHADLPAIIQNDGWSCSVTSLRWAMTAMGRDPDEGWMEGTALIEGVVRMADGLQDATGAGLAAFVRRHYAELGYDANNEAFITFDNARFEGDHAYPILIGGRAWNHWSGVRGYDEASGQLLLANPFPGHMGVGQTMSRAQFERLGSFSMVRVFHPDLLS